MYHQPNAGVTPIMLASAYGRPQLQARLAHQFPVAASEQNALGFTVADLMAAAKRESSIHL